MGKSLRPGKSVRVFVADSSALECQLMVRALQRSCNAIKVVGSAAESVQIRKGLNKSFPEVVIISADLSDGRGAGLQIVREVRASYPRTRVVVLVESPERETVVEGFRAGADGVFSRREPFEMLCKCIHTVCAGQVWASSEVLRLVIDAMPQSEEQQPIKNPSGTRLLTKREEELVQLVAEGLNNRDISRRLSVREHTVRNYLFRIFNKLGTSSRLELALYVMKQKGADHGSLVGRMLPAGGAARATGDRPLNPRSRRREVSLKSGLPLMG